MSESPTSPARQSAVSSSDQPATLSKATLQNSKKLVNYRIAGRFKLSRRLGGGAFGDVYHAVDLASNDPVAVKLEPTHSIHQPHLQHEARLYMYLQKSTSISAGIPRVRWFGREGDFNVMVMELLGPSLEDIFEFCGRKFSIKTVLMLADQMISRLEYMHALNYLHRDLKPENFAMGLGKRSHHCYIIDMGLAKRYRDSKTGEHIPYIDGKSLTGTARYVSINTHLGVQQSRRDDLEALGLVLIYLARSGLPWQGVKCPTKQAKYERIKQLKMQISSQTLCEGLPNAFLVFLMYTRSLGFEESPDYQRCRQLFADAMEEKGYEHDYQFTWLKYSSRAALSETSSTASGGSSIVYPKPNRQPSINMLSPTSHGPGETSSQSSRQSKWGGTSALSVSAHTEVSQGPGNTPSRSHVQPPAGRQTHDALDAGGQDSPSRPKPGQSSSAFNIIAESAQNTPGGSTDGDHLNTSGIRRSFLNPPGSNRPGLDRNNTTQLLLADDVPDSVTVEVPGPKEDTSPLGGRRKSEAELDTSASGLGTSMQADIGDEDSTSRRTPSKTE